VAVKPPAKSPVAYHCAYRQTGGKWFAGNSATSSDLVMDGEAGPEVAELQCLLQHAGISAGGIDGQFGPMTLHAVIEEQLARHIDVDGQVGPQTWAALRG
jgi:peptidoglycan hydrolase-like protein with peptidoglycan-binding domain